MNHMPGISVRTKERVFAAARELRYRPSTFGRGLVKPGQPTLGLIIDDLTNPYYPELASAVIGQAARYRWNVVLAETVHIQDKHQLIIDLSRQTDALLGYFSIDPEQLTDELAVTPFVQLDTAPPAPTGSVALDFRAAMDDLVEHLVARGIQHPALLDVTKPDATSARGQRFVDGMRRHGRHVAVTRIEESSMDAGVKGGRAVLSACPETDGIVAFNDVVACGVLKMLQLDGIAVPDRIRVAGYDGLTLGTFVTPQLTTIEINMRAVAETAVDLALGMYAGDLPMSGPECHRTVTHRLVVREST